MAQQKNIIRLCFISLLFITYVYAEVINVNVGGLGGVLKFDPQNVTDAKMGDTIVWQFLGGQHSVVQSDGLASCDPSQKPGAFQSVTNPPSKQYTYNIVDAKTTIYYFCGFSSHCQSGMWGAIYVGGTAPPGVTGTPTANSTATASAVPSAKAGSAVKSVNFKLVASLIVFALIKFLF